jgi:hypothetical protein
MIDLRFVSVRVGVRRPDFRPGVRTAVIAALLVAGCSGSGGQWDEPARTAAVQFLDELRAGRLEPAWRGCSTEFKSLMGLENLRDYMKAHAALRSAAEFTEVRPIQRNGQTMAECRFRGISKQRGKEVTATIKVLVASADEGWKVEQVVVE